VRFLKLVFIFFIGLLIFAGGKCARSFNGYCASANKYFSEEELLRETIKLVIKSEEKSVSFLNLEQQRNAVNYESVAHFIEQNPNCCKVIFKGGNRHINML